MAPSESEILTLLSSQSYSPSSAAPLEEYLAAQVAGEAPYMFDAVRTLVKIYQLFPDTKKDENIKSACMLALLEYPNTDILALNYLIPPSVDVSDIQTCAKQLDACQFTEFWKSLEAISDSKIKAMGQKSVKRFQEAIAQVLALTYQVAPLSVVSKALNTDKDIASLAVVEKVEGDKVLFVKTSDNTKRERVYQEGVNFATVSSLLHKISQ